MMKLQHIGLLVFVLGTLLFACSAEPQVVEVTVEVEKEVVKEVEVEVTRVVEVEVEVVREVEVEAEKEIPVTDVFLVATSSIDEGFGAQGSEDSAEPTPIPPRPKEITAIVLNPMPQHRPTVTNIARNVDPIPEPTASAILALANNSSTPTPLEHATNQLDFIYSVLRRIEAIMESLSRILSLDF